MLVGAKMLMDPLVLKKKMNRYGNAGDLAVLTSLLSYITELASRTSQDKDKISTASEVTSHKNSHYSKPLSTKDNNCSSTAKRPTKFQLLQSRFMNPNHAPPIKRTREVGRLIFKEKQSVTRVSIGPKIYKLDRAKEKKEDATEENKRATAADRVRWTHPSGKNTVKNILRKFMAAEEKAQEKPETCKEKPLTNLPKILNKNSMLSKLKEKFEQTSSLCSVTKVNLTLTPTNVKSRKKDPLMRQICKAKILEMQDDTEAATGITPPVSHYLACTEDSPPLFHSASVLSYPLSMCNRVSDVSEAVSSYADSKKLTGKILVNSVVNKNYEGQDSDKTVHPQTSQSHLIDDAKPGVPAIATVLDEAHNSNNSVTSSSVTCEANFIYTVNGNSRVPENLVAVVDGKKTSNKTSAIPASENGQSSTSNSAEYQKSVDDMHENVVLDINLENQNITENGNCIPLSAISTRNNVQATHEMLANSVLVCKATKQDVTELQKASFIENANSSDEMPKTKMADVVHKISPSMSFDVPVTHNTAISNSGCPEDIESVVGQAQESSTEVNKVPMTAESIPQVTGNINPVPKPTEPLTSDIKNELQADPSLRRSKFIGSQNKEAGISVQDGPHRALPTAEVCEAPKANDNCKDLIETKIDFTNQGHECVPALVSSCDNSALDHHSPATVRQKEEYTSEGSVGWSRAPHHGVGCSKTEGLKNPYFLAPSLGAAAYPHMCMSQSKPDNTLPNNFTAQNIILVETVSEMNPSLSLIQAKASCDVETPIVTAQSVPQAPTVHEAALSAPGKDNGPCVKSKAPSTLEPLIDSKTSNTATTMRKDDDSMNEKLPKSQMSTKSQIRKRKSDQSPLGQDKKDKVTGNTTTLPQDKKDKITMSASHVQQDNNKSTVIKAFLENISDNNTLSAITMQDNKVDNRSAKAPQLQKNNNSLSTVDTTIYQNKKNEKTTGNSTPLLGSNVDNSNMVKSQQQDKIYKLDVNATPTQLDNCYQSAECKTQQKDKNDRSIENESPQQQYTNEKSSEIETPKQQDEKHKSTDNETQKQVKYHQSIANENPKKKDKNHKSTVNEMPKNQDKIHKGTVNETSKKQEKTHKSTVNETPKKLDKIHKSTVNETPKQQDKTPKSLVNETPKQQDKTPKSLVNETPKQQGKDHKSTVNETPKQQDKTPKSPVNETPMQKGKDHRSTANETQKQEQNHKSTLNEAPKKHAKNHKSTLHESPKQQCERDTSTVNRTSGKYRILPPEETVEHKQATAGASASSLQSSSLQDCKTISKVSVARLHSPKYIAESYGEDNITRKETFKPLVIRASDTFKCEN